MYDDVNWEDYTQIRYQEDNEIITVENDVRFNPDEDMDYMKCDAFVEDYVG